MRAMTELREDGFAPQQVLSQVFKAQIKKGGNLLAVRVNSGSGGFRLVSGGPDEVAAARRERSGGRDALIVELVRGDRSLAREPVLVEVLRPLERLTGAPDWNSLAIDGQHGPVTNLFIAQPEASRHYHGANDLAAHVTQRNAGIIHQSR